MKKDVFDYELTKEEQIIAHAIKYAVAVSDEMARDYKAVIGLLTIHADLDAHTVDFRREIDFPRLSALTERAVKMCYEELARINAVQDEPMQEIAQGVDMVHKIDVKGVLQNAEAEFYSFLVDCCRQ